MTTLQTTSLILGIGIGILIASGICILTFLLYKPNIEQDEQENETFDV